MNIDKNVSSPIILKTQRSPELWSRSIMWMAVFLANFFFYKYFYLVDGRKELLSPLAETLCLIPAFVLIEICIFLIEVDRQKKETWSISSEIISFNRDGNPHRRREIRLEDITHVKLNAISRGLERGARVRDNKSHVIFIPQITDRFYEAEIFLRQHVVKQK